MEFPHEIVVVDDGSTDRTWEILQHQKERIPELTAPQTTVEQAFGHAVQHGLDSAAGDAIVIMMADESDDCRDVVRYWEKLNEGFDCVFGSRFVRGGRVIDYPPIDMVLNRLANFFVRILFQYRLNDTSNTFKAYRKTCSTDRVRSSRRILTSRSNCRSSPSPVDIRGR